VIAFRPYRKVIFVDARDLSLIDFDCGRLPGAGRDDVEHSS
jgi:hypothetical protein